MRKTRKQIERIRRELRAKDDGLVAGAVDAITRQSILVRPDRLHQLAVMEIKEHLEPDEYWKNDPSYWWAEKKKKKKSEEEKCR